MGSQLSLHQKVMHNPVACAAEQIVVTLLGASGSGIPASEHLEGVAGTLTLDSTACPEPPRWPSNAGFVGGIQCCRTAQSATFPAAAMVVMRAMV